MLALGLEKFSELFVLEVLLRLLRKVRGNKMHGFCSLVVHFKEDQAMQRVVTAFFGGEIHEH